MIRKILSYRATRVLLWIFVTLATLIVLPFMWANWSGERRWAATKTLIEREGETLDFHALLPAAPPEAENLLAIEPLRGIAEVIGNDASKGEPGAKRAALVAMKWGAGAPAANGVSLGKVTDFQEWAKFLSDAKFLDLVAGSPASGNDVLAALDARFPLLKQLADEAPKRPQAMFTPALREREMPDILFSLSMAHYSGVPALARLLTLRARAAVDAKNGAEAVRSIIAVSRIAHACEQEPLLIGLLVGITVDSMALESLWHGLRERVFAEAEMRQLQEVYAEDETAKALLQAVRGELAAGVDAVEHVQESREDFISGLGNESPGSRANFFKLLPNGLFNHWKSVIGEVEMHHLILPLKQGIPAAMRAGEALEQEIKSKSNVVRHPDWIMARLLVPTVKQVSLSAWLAAARKQQALAATALERFFAKHGVYPAKVGELVPEFLPAVPLDPCDGKPLRYRMTAAGRFTLWSISFDGQDDGGKVHVDAKGAAKLNKREYLGDWTWQYEPVK
jgi:hypothetical protein